MKGCPGGTSENSPAFQRPVWPQEMEPSPGGRLKWSSGSRSHFSRAYGTIRPGVIPPASELAGYFRRSLRDPFRPQRFPLFHVPAADFDRRVGRTQFAGAVRCCAFALLAGHQGDVVVFPHDRQDLFSLDAFVDLQADKERETLVRGLFRSAYEPFFCSNSAGEW